MGVGTYYWEQLGEAMGLKPGDILAPDQDVVQAYIDAKAQSQIPASALRSGPLAEVLRFTDYEPLIDANQAIAVLPSPFDAAGEVIEGEATDVTGRGPVTDMSMDDVFDSLNEAIDEDNAQKALPAPEAEAPETDPDDPNKPKGTGKKVAGAAAAAAGIPSIRCSKSSACGRGGYAAFSYSRASRQIWTHTCYGSGTRNNRRSRCPRGRSDSGWGNCLRLR